MTYALWLEMDAGFGDCQKELVCAYTAECISMRFCVCDLSTLHSYNILFFWERDTAALPSSLLEILQAPAGMSKNSVIYPDTYILDCGVAELILDGELWLREPGLLVRYRSDLQATPDSKMTIKIVNEFI